MISKNFKKRLYTSFSLLILAVLVFMYMPLLTFILLIVGNLSMVEFSQIIKKISKNKTVNLVLNLSFITYFFLFSLIFFILSISLSTKIILFSLLLCCIASDTGGYFFGKLFKGPKLISISPNKTISGSIGSFILSNLILLLIYYNFKLNISIDIFLIATSTSLGCQLGDIFFSYLKRKASIKDTGNFLPGHGGFLDRIDGILFGIPLGLLLIAYLN
jgi:phosphatidate cytidylyltransferase